MIYRKVLFFGVLLTLLSGCATTRYISKQNPFPNGDQIVVGKPNIVIDSLGNIISLPKKIILLDHRVDNHIVSPKTIEVLKQYIKDNPAMQETKVRINQFALVDEFRRLGINQKIHWWWRVFPGIPVTLISCAGRLLGGDNYNPYSDTINIYSDLVPVVLHEAGHAVDTAERVKEGWADYYTVGRILPPVTFYQEYVASEKTIAYLEKTKNRKEENNAYRVLYPAYGTYAGSYSGLAYGDAIGAAAGHLLSIIPRYDNKVIAKVYNDSVKFNQPVTDLSSDYLAKSLYQDYERREQELNKALNLHGGTGDSKN